LLVISATWPYSCQSAASRIYRIYKPFAISLVAVLHFVGGEKRPHDIVEILKAEDLHFDHKIPFSAGGTNAVNNIQLMCGSCDRRKGKDDTSDET
jgi:hypothetical protein